MRRVFVFWNLILVILISGSTAITCGKFLLSRETKQAEVIRGELTEIARARVEARLVVEAYKSPESVEIPEIRESDENRTGSMAPYRHTLPTIPRFHKPVSEIIYE